MWPNPPFPNIYTHTHTEKNSKGKKMCSIWIDRKRHWKEKNTCEILLAREKIKGFVHRVVIGAEKWIYVDSPKRKTSREDPGHPSTSQPVHNNLERRLCCVFDRIIDGLCTMNR